MPPILIFMLRVLFVLLIFILVTVAAYISGVILTSLADGLFPPIEGQPSTDPRGRGVNSAADVGLGSSICLLLGAVGGWIAWLLTDRKQWSVDLFVATPIFLFLAMVSSANYIYDDVIFTRDAQAFLNLLLLASGIATVFVLQKTVRASLPVIVSVLAHLLLMFCIFAFVAIPLWYSISFFSWKLGAGKLNSLDATVKAISAICSLLAVLGLSWKNGKLKLTSDPRGSVDSK